ncbi:MAG: addiction module protein [Clostridia bacterium]|nr:addiction module protein [Clostridia bacterium]
MQQELELDPATRADLAAKLLRSLEELSYAENERLWAKEAQRRPDEFLAGRGSERPAEDVFRDARAHLLLRRFPYSIMYSLLPNTIRILAIANQKRRPLYWCGRQ